MLGRSRPPVTPTNEAFVTVPVYTPDPIGAALFCGVVDGNALGGRPVIDARGMPANGAVPTPQRRDMNTAANLGGGRAVVPPGSALHQTRGVAKDSVQETFEQRAAARRFS